MSVVLCGSCAWAVLASAAAAKPEPTPVDEIVVTASKREERLRDVPASVTALSADALQRIQAQRFDDYLNRVPSAVLISGRQGETQIVLRGVTSGANQTNPSVGTYVDETPYGSSTVFASGNTLTPDLDPFDVERIEVLRGPQGTLYGASTLGGLLKFVTARPDPGGLHGRVEVGGQSIEHGDTGFTVKGMLNLPLVADKAALRVSAYHRDDPGFIDDPLLGSSDVDGAKVDGGRASLLLKPSERITLRLTAIAQKLEAGSTSSMDVDRVTLRPLYGDLAQRRDLRQDLNIDYRLYNATLDWDLEWATLTSTTSQGSLTKTGFTDISVAYGALLGGLDVGNQSDTDYDKFTQEVRLAGEDGPLQWTAGVFYTRETSGSHQQILPFNPVTKAPFTGLPTLYEVQLPSRFREYAAFGTATWRFTPAFDVTVGGRWSRNEQTFSQITKGLLNNPANPALVSAFTRSSSEETFTYLFSPRYRISDDLMVYGRIAKGYRPGGPNVTPPAAAGIAPVTFDADTLVNYEVGLKGAWLEHRLTLDASLFFIDWSKVQLTTSAGGFSFLGNGGAAESKGAEWNLGYTPLVGLSLSFSGAYTKATLTEAAPAIGGRSGDRLPYVPEWSGAANIDYQWTVGADYVASVGASYRFIGDRETSYGADATRVKLSSYEVVDLRAAVARGDVTVAAYVKNLFDERGVNAAAGLTLVPGGNPYTAAVIRPLTIGLSITAGF